MFQNTTKYVYRYICSTNNTSINV